MKFNSQICTSIEQSRRLLELGLKKDTADMVWLNHAVTEEYEDWKATSMEEWDDWDKNSIPAWSLHRLLEMYVERYLSCSVNLKDFTYEWLINEIEIHIKEGDFNKDYLVNQTEIDEHCKGVLEYLDYIREEE